MHKPAATVSQEESSPLLALPSRCGLRGTCSRERSRKTPITSSTSDAFSYIVLHPTRHAGRDASLRALQVSRSATFWKGGGSLEESAVEESSAVGAVEESSAVEGRCCR